jgi:hypothetical protein
LLQFFETDKAPVPGSVPKPDKAEDPTTYQESLMQNLGTTFTVQDRMVLLPMKQNNLKYAVSHLFLLPHPLLGFVDMTKYRVPSLTAGYLIGWLDVCKKLAYWLL